MAPSGALLGPGDASKKMSSSSLRFALVLLALLLAPPSASAAVGREFIGMNQGAALDHRDLQKIGATGVRADRFLLSWQSVQPTEGSFKWGPTDRLIGGGASRGIRAAPFIWGSPGWIASKPSYPPIGNATKRHAWRDFLRAAVDRYGPNGFYWTHGYRADYGSGAKPLPVKAWQVWTEPNGKAYFAPRPSAGRYATLLRISHDAIKGADAHAKVVLSGLVGLRKWHGRRLKGVEGWEFLRRLYNVRGVKGNFDVAAVHPYAPNLDQLRRQLKLMRRTMRKAHDKRTSLWITELGWGSAPKGSGHSVLGLNKGMEGQSRLLSKSFKLILHHRREWRLGRLFWYDWRDPSKTARAPCSFCESSGLLRHNREPKPAYYAFKRFTR
jgi:polysaccharide biosynthesis protein PslG